MISTASRRGLGVVWVAWVPAVLIGMHCTVVVAVDRPLNVVLIVSDDHVHNALGCAGNSAIRTPNLDRLAQDGVRFTHAFVSIPICTPSRAAFLTGRSGAHSGVTFFGQAVRPGVENWPTLFGRRGYQTAATGKWHNDGRPATRGFAWTSNVFLGGMGGYTDPKLVQGADDPPTVVKGNITELITDAAVRFLETRDESRPFFLYVAYTAPHDPRTPPPEYEAMYPPANMPLPANFMPRPVPWHEVTLDIRDERLLPVPRDAESIQRETGRYYGLITHLDAQIGRVLQTLERRKLDGDTIVMFAGDNGLTLGAHGLLGKQTMYEEGIRVPLIIRHPRLGVKGETRDALVDLMDLLPTACAWTETPVPAGVDGRSLTHAYMDNAAKVRDVLFCRYDDAFRMARTERYKLIQYLKANREELFDLREDPLELKDRSNDPALAETRDHLRVQLSEWRKSQDDEKGDRGGDAPRKSTAKTQTSAAVDKPERPNVILIMTDDQGIGDLSIMGNPVLRTPNLDRLATGGARMTRFYVSPVCTPTRASLMTGRYNYRTRAIDTYVGRAMMDPAEVTVAEVLRDAGYATGIFGKWHLGDNYPMRAMDQGFAESLVIRGGGIGQPSDPPGGEGKYTDPILFHNGRQVQARGYCTDVYFDAAVEWIDQQTRSSHRIG